MEAVNKVSEKQIDIQDVRKIISVVKDVYDFDFGEYALSSFKRRLVRILDVFDFDTTSKLIARLSSDKDFFETFLKEITVNTTEMFRDPSFWKELKENVFPVVAEYPSIRIWHAACSSGEEVYSMAIALKEAGLYDKAKIFASDINEDVIAKALVGIYPIRNMALNGLNYENCGGKAKLTDFYKKSGEVAIMDLDLLKNVTFKKFDLIQSKQPLTFDIVLCRNVLIYFTIPLQDEIVNKFSTNLAKGGFLAVGSKETILWYKSAQYYSTFSQEGKIFKKKDKVE